MEKMDVFSKGKLRKCTPKKMPVLEHDLNCQQLFLSLLSRVNLKAYTITRYLYLMIIDNIGAVWAMIGFCWYKPILAKEDGFLHPLKVGGFRLKEP